MRFILNTLFFIFIFFLFKETTYLAFELIEIDENQTFIGEPKDMLIMQLGVFAFSVFMVFTFYFVESFYEKLFKNKIVAKALILIILLITQTLILSTIFFLKISNVLNIYPKTYLITLGISAFVIILMVIIVLIFKSYNTILRERTS